MASSVTTEAAIAAGILLSSCLRISKIVRVKEYTEQVPFWISLGCLSFLGSCAASARGKVVNAFGCGLYDTRMMRKIRCIDPIERIERSQGNATSAWASNILVICTVVLVPFIELFVLSEKSINQIMETDIDLTTLQSHPQALLSTIHDVAVVTLPIRWLIRSILLLGTTFDSLLFGNYHGHRHASQLLPFIWLVYAAVIVGTKSFEDQIPVQVGVTVFITIAIELIMGKLLSCLKSKIEDLHSGGIRSGNISLAALQMMPLYTTAAFELLTLMVYDRISLASILTPEAFCTSIIMWTSLSVVLTVFLCFARPKFIKHATRYPHSEEGKTLSMLPLFSLCTTLAVVYLLLNHWTEYTDFTYDSYTNRSPRRSPSPLHLVINRYLGTDVFLVPTPLKHPTDCDPLINNFCALRERWGMNNDVWNPAMYNLFLELFLGLYVLGIGIPAAIFLSRVKILFRKYWHVVVYQAMVIPFVVELGTMPEPLPSWDGLRGIGFGLLSVVLLGLAVFSCTVIAKIHQYTFPMVLGEICHSGFRLVSDEREEQNPLALCIWEFFLGCLVAPAFCLIVLPLLEFYGILPQLKIPLHAVIELVLLCASTSCIGDSAASLAGVLMKTVLPSFTRKYTMRNGKTIFGLLSYILSVLGIFYALRSLLLLENYFTHNSLLLATSVTALLESTSGEYDNAIAPATALYILLRTGIST